MRRESDRLLAFFFWRNADDPDRVRALAEELSEIAVDADEAAAAAAQSRPARDTIAGCGTWADP